MFTFKLALARMAARYAGLAAKLRLLAVKFALCGFNSKAVGVLFTIGRWHISQKRESLSSGLFCGV